MANEISIRSLIATPGINTKLLSGSEGLDRTVLWAHSCELSDPARWLGPHELLMTIGLCIPQGANAQRDFIAKLDEAGLAGIAIGDHGMMPRLTNAMFAESDQRGFPILMTEPETPFAAIGRTIAAANANRQTMSVLMLAKLYQIAGRRDVQKRRSGTDLNDLFGTTISVFDDATRCVLIGEGLLGPTGERTHPLRTHRPAQLHVADDSALDGFTLMHLEQVLSVDANSILQEVRRKIYEGSTALDLALSGHNEGYSSIAGIWGEESSAFQVIVTENLIPQQVQLAFALNDITPTLSENSDRVIAAIPSSQVEAAKAILEKLGLTAAGSSLHRDLSDLSGAVAEATSEFFNAVKRGEGWREFHGNQVSLLARSRSEAEQIVQTVLGPLAGEEPKYQSLRETLFAFLDNDMKWGVTAEELHLHRGTLVYRLEQIEELTTRSVRRTHDLSDFWLARTAWKLLH